MKATDEYKVCTLEEAEAFARKREKMNEHGYCPKCNADLDGGSIWEHFYKLTGSEEKADKSAKAYGATKEKGQWGRAVGIYDRDLDRTVAWFCPDCHHKWGRL